MKLDIRNIKTVVISPEHNEKYRTRKEKTMNLLRFHEFKDVTHFKSGTEKYPTCLTLANIEILKQNLNDKPVLILEDDIELTKIPDVLEIDDDTDALYIGLSIHGGHPRFNTNVDQGVDVHSVGDAISKVYNMLGTHAIVYISSRYKTAVIDVLEKTLGSHMDVMISRIQKFFNVMCLNTPIFFQNDECDPKNSLATQIKFS
jgi:hypothetical protein